MKDISSKKISNGQTARSHKRQTLESSKQHKEPYVGGPSEASLPKVGHTISSDVPEETSAHIPTELPKIDALKWGHTRVACSFAGQGVEAFPILERVLQERPHLRIWVEAAAQQIERCMKEKVLRWSGLYAHGFSLIDWLDHPASRPAKEYLSSSVISQALIFISQIVHYQDLYERGLNEAIAAGAIPVWGGHSQGMMPALLIAESPQGEIDLERFQEYVAYMVWQGYAMAEAYRISGQAQDQAFLARAQQGSEEQGLLTQMAAISGLDRAQLETLLKHFQKSIPPSEHAVISLYNTRTRHVLSGPIATLERFRQALTARAQSESKKKKEGLLGGSPLQFSWEYLMVGAAYHSPYMQPGVDTMRACVRSIGFKMDASALLADVLHPTTGLPFNTVEDLTDEIIVAQFVRSVNWLETSRALASYEHVEAILDLGPGDGVMRLSRSALRGLGVDVLALDTEEGRLALFEAKQELRRKKPLRYADFLPTYTTAPDGQSYIENRYTRATGHSPVLLPGMTPTTVDVPIVAAAANAGYTAELAGGGQVSESIFWNRMEELQDALEPGREIVFNALFLDPYLWNLHLGRQGLVQKARKAGYPICGVTITAGLPEVDEAVRLLDEFNALGMWLNAFKPGTVEQVQHVLRIAKAAADRPYTIFVHLEGGKAGGHHSWEDLDQLLLSSYHALRSQDNIVLCVGGGIADEARSTALLSGEWSRAYGQPLMPVDAVFLGTLAMACKEATTSPQVKQALVDAAGDSNWVFAGEAKGNITSGKSALNADIHYIDNTAARCGRLLDQVAGDAEAVAEQREAIIELLNQTAKPYFGDLESMTYADVLERMVDLMAIGRSTRYEDGVWPDVTYRQRFADFIWRTEERIHPKDEGSFESVLRSQKELDTPREWLSTFLDMYPTTRSIQLHPADRLFFIHEVCARPGKPVNFVPIVDADVRRWYKADSLWQAHDPRYTAEQVLIIPGPEAIKGLDYADEPIADLLGRFEQDLSTSEVIHTQVEPVSLGIQSALLHEATPVHWSLSVMGERCMLYIQESDEKEHEEALCAWAGRGFDGELAALFAAPQIYIGKESTHNPLRSMCHALAGASLQIEPNEWLYRAPKEESNSIVEEVRIRRSSERPNWIQIQAGMASSFTQQSIVAGDPVSFVLDVRVFKDVRGFRFGVEPSSWKDAVRRFYQLSMFGQLLEAAPLFESARDTTRVSEVQARAYKAVAGGLPNTSDVSVNFVFSLAWKPLFQLLSCDELVGGLFQLVHQENNVQCHEAWPIVAGDTLDIQARVTRVEDTESGRQIVTMSQLRRDGLLCATLESIFFIRGAFGRTQWTTRSREDILHSFVLQDEADIRFIQSFEGFVWKEGTQLCVQDVLSLELELKEEHPRVGATRFVAKGQVLREEVCVGTVEYDVENDATMHPIRACMEMFQSKEEYSQSRTPVLLASEQIFAPHHMASFAEISGDFNPIHQQYLFAKMAGFSKPIVHGMWTASRLEQFVVASVAGGRSEDVRDVHVSFLAPIEPGAALVLDARRIGVDGGRTEIEAHAWILQGDDVLPAVRLTAFIAGPSTGYVFPGQGIQRQGMGMEGYNRSKAARSIWDRADAFTSEQLGFSILHIVRENPKTLDVLNTRLVHPQGVLHLTQFTQVAMAVLAQAQVAELREANVMVEGAITCGHSLGEYNALGAVVQVLPLESVVEIVYRRGQVMHELVERDETGESGYRMMVIRPHYAGLNHAQAEALVEDIYKETGSFIQIVNYNVKGRQYAVTGKMQALSVLQERLSARAGKGAKAPCVEVPGIDVPFHSSMLRDGVPNFRDTLRRVLPDPIDYTVLMGHYIPNLVPKPFSLERAFVQEVAETSDSHVLHEVLASFDAWSQKPADLARVLLIELLAWQFASPVRWIETQELLFKSKEQGGLGVERLIEVGVGYQPTLANMAQYSLRLMGVGAPFIEVQNVEADFASVCGRNGEEAPRTPDKSAFPKSALPAFDIEVSESAPTASQVAPPVPESLAPEVSAAPVVSTTVATSGQLEGSVSTEDALYCLLALQGKVRIEQIHKDETIDDIFDGVSSRRNQLLLDLGAELDMGAIDGAHEKPLSELVTAIASTVRRYQAPGPYLLSVQNDTIRKTFGRAGLNRKELTQYMQETFGLGEGLCVAAFNTLALEVREGESARGGTLGQCGGQVATDRATGLALMDQIVEQMGRSKGMTLAKKSAASGGDGAVVDSAALKELEESLLGTRGVLMNTARDLASHLGHDLEHATDSEMALEMERLQSELQHVEAEHGREYLDWIRPKFEAEKHIALSSIWAFSKRDVARFFYDVMSHRVSASEMQKEANRLARHASNAEVHETACWYAGLAENAGAVELATALKTIAEGQYVASAPFECTRPTLSFGAGGCIQYKEVLDTESPDCASFVDALWPSEGSSAVHIRAAATWDDATYQALLHKGLEAPFAFQGKTALVTGASPDSIAIACVRHLLRGGARVIVTTSSYHAKRMAYYRSLYIQEAVAGAELHVVPFNQASFQDVDALVDWIFHEKTEQAGAEVRVLKRAWSLDLFLPFAAIKDLATLDHLGMKSNVVMRGMLLGVERLIASVARETIQMHRTQLPCHVVLPLSPNHGTFGGDGVYAETKAAMEVLLEKWYSESDAWAKGVTFCGAQIGWVRGTGLMDDNNPVAAMLEQHTPVRTFSNEEMGYLLTALLSEDAQQEAKQKPLVVNLSGGFSDVEDLKGTVDGFRDEIGQRTSMLRKHAQLHQRKRDLLGIEKATSERKALPLWSSAVSADEDFVSVDDVFTRLPECELERMVVIVGTGEVGPWGHSDTRFEMEVDGTLSAAGVLELAWMTGLVRFEYNGRKGQWIDSETEDVVEESDIAERYREAVMERGGIRWTEPETIGFDPQNLPVMATVYLEKDFSFSVASEAEARSFVQSDPALTQMQWDEETSSWKVTRRAGSEVRVPRKARLKRAVLGMIPSNFDFSKYGIPKDMLEHTDRIALFNLVATVQAFVQSGFSPEELMRWVHPARVANTQGAGIGGMQSLHRLYLDHFIDAERQQDILQETLINVVAAHVVQSYVGSYGTMSHPVGACATAAVSLEEAFDKLLVDKADFVVSGGFDDVGREGMVGFGDMHATADTDEMTQMGFEPSQMSRPNDIRRRGFVEAQGGGTLLLTRASIAAKLGLPVRGVLAYAGSFGDGLQKSIPAPGMGALASAMGGVQSPLGRALSKLGLNADDIGVVSKHDTSTNANDKNENALHHRIQTALGRTSGNPLFTISQKSLTGHAKGGAAAWQSIGLLQAMHQGVIPGNRNLESVDQVMQPYAHMAFTEESIRMHRPIRAGLLTSLGFGHVSGIALFVHRDAFLAQLSEDTKTSYLEALRQRNRKANYQWAEVILGLEQAFDKRSHRRFHAPDGSQAQADEEAALLLNEQARLDMASGCFK